MLNALRSFRAQPVPAVFPGRNASAGSVRFVQQAVPPNQQGKESMEQNASSQMTEAAIESFGEGYATRSDEEGFGGVYGGNQYLNKKDEEAIKDGGTTKNDASQGSEVKEKEKARNQKSVT